MNCGSLSFMKAQSCVNGLVRSYMPTLTAYTETWCRVSTLSRSAAICSETS